MEPRELLLALMARDGDNPHSLAVKLKHRPGQPQIHKYLSGVAKEPRRTTLLPVAEHFEVPVEAFYDPAVAAAAAKRLRLDAGDTAPSLVKERTPDYQLDNVETVTPRRSVPLISWVIAGNWAEVQDTFQPGDAEEWVDAVDTFPGKHAFALRVVGDSMTSPLPGQRSFPEGTIIIVDPTRGVGAGDFVVAKDVQTQKATFKQLMTDGGRWFLRPLNPSYPTVEIDDPGVRVIGRVMEFRLGGKL